MAKKIVGQVKLQCPGGEAKPGPPVGPVLGAAGVNIPMFIKDFNAKTADKKGWVIPVIITVYSDKSFTFELKTPPASILLVKALGKEKGSAKPNREKIGTLPMSKIDEITKTKMVDLNTDDFNAAKRMILGTARSMGIEVDGVTFG
ncbi:MAG: 50S ribosomal protein L11 [Deltaproteobacteria bacterium]|nr:50S ribosomal protein L11 [Deltaproteobacteria bacterium]